MTGSEFWHIEISTSSPACSPTLQGVSIVSELALNANNQAGVTVVPIEDLQLHREIVCLILRQMTAHQRLFVRFITEMYQTNGLTQSNDLSNHQT